MPLDDEPWGYCRWCARDVALKPSAVDGSMRLASHKAYVGDCDGSWEKPHKRPQQFSRRFAFKTIEDDGGQEMAGLKRPYQTIYGRRTRRDD